MKKTYIAPKSNVIELETTSLMTGSDPLPIYDVLGDDEVLEGGSRSTLWGED